MNDEEKTKWSAMQREWLKRNLYKIGFDWTGFAILAGLIAGAVFTGILLWKSAAGVYHLIDKLIDKI